MRVESGQRGSRCQRPLPQSQRSICPCSHPSTCLSRVPCAGTPPVLRTSALVAEQAPHEARATRQPPTRPTPAAGRCSAAAKPALPAAPHTPHTRGSSIPAGAASTASTLSSAGSAYAAMNDATSAWPSTRRMSRPGAEAGGWPPPPPAAAAPPSSSARRITAGGHVCVR